MKLRFLILTLLPISIFAQNFVRVTKPPFVNVGNSTLLSFDADRDGLLDVLVMGKTGSSYFTKLYHNNGDSTFVDLGIAFPGLAYGSADVFDFNNDGLLDLVLCGSDGTNKRFCLFRNKGNNLFAEQTVSIPGVDYATVRCADFDLDGKTDIAVSGETSSQKIFRIFSNKGNGTFTESKQLDGMYDGSFDVADLNNDAYPDIVATGVNNQFDLMSKVYINRGGRTFTERVSNIPALRGGSLRIFDFNNDGYNDVLVTGKDADDNYTSEVYKNNSGETFTLFASLEGLYYSAATTGDFNTDGYPDIVINGLKSNGSYYSVYYINNAGAGFTVQASVFSNLFKGSVCPIELTNDNRLDLLMGGYTMGGPVSYAYHNVDAIPNTLPNAPENLTSVSDVDSVILRWKAPADAETSARSLTFDFYLRKASTGDTVYSAPANFLSGGRYVCRQGAVSDTFIVIKGLPYGKYYWSVQAVDPGFKGSLFASEGEFNVCYNLSLGADTSICDGSSITLGAGDANDVISWYKSDEPFTSFSNGMMTPITVTKDCRVWVDVVTPIGCNLSDTIHLSVLSLPQTWSSKDTGICTHSTIHLSLVQNNYLADWNSSQGSILVDSVNTAEFEILTSDTIFTRIVDNKGCVNYDTLRIKAYALPQTFLPADTATCFQTFINLSAASSFDSVYWYDSGKNLLSDTNVLRYYSVATSALQIKVVSPWKCITVDTIVVNSLPLPPTNAGRDTLICPKGVVRLGDSLIIASNMLYEWIPSQPLNNSSLSSPMAQPDSSTFFVLKQTDTYGCVNFDTVLVSINPPSTLITGGDKAVCIGKEVLLGGSPTATGSMLSYSFKWIPENGLDDSSSPNPVAKPDTTTQYQLIVYTAGCVWDTVPVKVTVWPLPLITKSKDYVIGYQESALIWASGGISYQWKPETGLSDAYISNPIAMPLEFTAYSVFVTDSNGCESSAQISVTIRNELFVPTLFTPNGDGKNDFFKIYGTGIDKIHLRIYNTEGILVFETSTREGAAQSGWDGTVDGKLQEAGRYLWVIEAADTQGNVLLFKGSNKGIVTLLR